MAFERIKALQRRGIDVVVVLDDDFQAVPIANSAYRDCSPVLSNLDELKLTASVVS